MHDQLRVPLKKHLFGYCTRRAGSAEKNSKIECRNFRNIIFSKKKCNTRKKGILEDILGISICQTLFFQKNNYSANGCRPALLAR
jgi:hypothetical protein